LCVYIYVSLARSKESPEKNIKNNNIIIITFF
jgi:hypothetical protein